MPPTGQTRRGRLSNSLRDRITSQLSNLKTHNTIYSIGHPTCHCHLLANQLRLLNPMQTKQYQTNQANDAENFRVQSSSRANN